MSKQFSVKLAGDAHVAVAKFQATAARHEVFFSGDHKSGEFSGKGIEGRYGINGDNLTIHIDKKPALIPWAMIESKVREFF